MPQQVPELPGRERRQAQPELPEQVQPEREPGWALLLQEPGPE